MQHLGRADAVEDVDADRLAPAQAECSGSASPAEMQRRSRFDPAPGPSSDGPATRRRASARRRRSSGGAAASPPAPHRGSAGRATARPRRRPPSGRSSRCRAHRRRTTSPPRTSGRRLRCRAPARHRYRRWPGGWRCTCLRPSGRRSSPTNRARTRPRRARLGGRRSASPWPGRRRRRREVNRRGRAAVGLGDDDAARSAMPLQRRQQRRKSGAETLRLGAAIVQDVAGDVGRQQRVDRHRDAPARSAPQNAIGKSTVSSMKSAIRRSRSMPAACSPAAKRADAANSAYVRLRHGIDERQPPAAPLAQVALDEKSTALPFASVIGPVPLPRHRDEVRHRRLLIFRQGQHVAVPRLPQCPQLVEQCRLLLRQIAALAMVVGDVEQVIRGRPV